MINEREFGLNPINKVRTVNQIYSFKLRYNKVSVCDIEVVSSKESLDRCKKVVNELIKTNKNFYHIKTK